MAMEVVFSRLEKLKIIERQELESIRESQRLKRKKKHIAKRKGKIDPRTNRPGKRK